MHLELGCQSWRWEGDQAKEISMGQIVKKGSTVLRSCGFILRAVGNHWRVLSWCCVGDGCINVGRIGDGGSDGGQLNQIYSLEMFHELRIDSLLLLVSKS